jgi:hypothetical protein
MPKLQTEIAAMHRTPGGRVEEHGSSDDSETPEAFEASLLQIQPSERGVDALHGLITRFEREGDAGKQLLAARRLLAVCTEHYGADHGDTSIAHNQVAAAARRAGHWEEAEREYRWTVSDLRRRGNKPDALVACLQYWAQCLSKLGRVIEFQAAIAEAIAATKSKNVILGLRANAILWGEGDRSHRIDALFALMSELTTPFEFLSIEADIVRSNLVKELIEERDPRALEVGERFLSAATEMRDVANLCYQHECVAQTHVLLGDSAKAAHHYNTALELAEQGNRPDIASRIRAVMTKGLPLKTTDSRARRKEEPGGSFVPVAYAFLSRTRVPHEVFEPLRAPVKLGRFAIRIEGPTFVAEAPDGLRALRLEWSDKLKDLRAAARRLPAPLQQEFVRRHSAVIIISALADMGSPVNQVPVPPELLGVYGHLHDLGAEMFDLVINGNPMP